VAIFIDGLNTMFRLRESGWEEFFDVCHFGRRVARNRELVAVYYFRVRPAIPPIKTRAQYWAEMRYLARVEKQVFDEFGLYVRYGYVVERHYGWQEKQTDVWLASEMVNHAWRDTYDIGILVTADTDLVPAVEIVRFLGKGVELVVFPKANPNVTQLVKAAHSTTTARSSFFQPY